MMRCFRCEKSGREVKLNDAIYENDLVKVCERCAITESIPVLRKPSTSQLRAAERSQGVYERLKKLSGVKEEERPHESVLDKIKKLDEHPDIERPEQKPSSLIHNYHWHVARARRNRGLSQTQLAWALGESETAIKMVEKGDLPEEPERLIRKLEQFFQIHLRERTPEQLEAERKKKEEFRMPKVEVVTEPIQPILEEEVDENDLADVERTEEVIEEAGRPAQVLKFKPELMDNITIADLKKLKDEKEAEESSSLREEELKKKEVREIVGQEMKNIALGKESDLISEKRDMLNRVMQKVSKEEKEDYVPSISELMEKRRDKEKSKVEEEKMRIQSLEKKSEQEQIKSVLRESPSAPESKTPELKPQLSSEPKPAIQETQKPPEPTLSELAEKKKQEKEDSLLGDDIEILDE